jgi:uncharacterized protein
MALKEILQEFLTEEGVTAVFVAGRDGFVIESAVSKQMDIDAVGAMVSAGLGSAEAMGKELDRGEMIQTLVEMANGPIILSPLSKDEMIAIVGDTSANSGRIRYVLKKSRDRIIAAL